MTGTEGGSHDERYPRNEYHAAVGSGAMIDPPIVAGIVHLHSERRAIATIDKLEQLVRAKGLTVFARIDFAGDAAAAGLAVPPVVQLVFGNPRAGTPLIQANPAVALVLPLRALAWEDADGHSWLTYETTESIVERFHLPQALGANIAGLRALCEAAVAP